MKHMNRLLLACLVYTFVSNPQDTIVTIDGVVKKLELGKCNVVQWSNLSDACKCCLISKYHKLAQGAQAKKIVQECIQNGLCTQETIQGLLLALDLPKEIASSQESSYRALLQRLYESSLILKTAPVEPSMLDERGEFTPQGLSYFLETAHSKGMLPYPEFKSVSCLSARNVIELKGFKTLQLFDVTSECSPSKQQFIVKEVSSFDELFRLAQSRSIPLLQEYIYPNKKKDFPVIVFPIAFLQYTDQKKNQHYLIVMPKAQGDNLEAIMKLFAQEQSSKNSFLAKDAYFQAGKTMANYHKLFMQDAEKGLAALHGDTQHKNISYDRSTNTIWWIDTEDIITFYNKPSPIAYDIIHILFWSIGITNVLKDNVLKKWIEVVFPAFIQGYASAYDEQTQKDITKKVVSIMRNYKNVDRYAQDPWYVVNYMPYVKPVLEKVLRDAAVSNKPPASHVS